MNTLSKILSPPTHYFLLCKIEISPSNLTKLLKNPILLFVKDYALMNIREKNHILCNKQRVCNHTANFKGEGRMNDCLSSNSSPP